MDGKGTSYEKSRTHAPSRSHRKAVSQPAVCPPLEVAPEHIKCEFCKKYLHACCVQDFLDSAREELKAYFGDYDYSIVRIPRAPWSGRYEIHASYSLRGERRYFVDGRGPTPWKALLSVNQMEQFLRKLAILA